MHIIFEFLRYLSQSQPAIYARLKSACVHVVFCGLCVASYFCLFYFSITNHCILYEQNVERVDSSHKAMPLNITISHQITFIIAIVVNLAWHTGRTSVFGRRTLPVSRSTFSLLVTTYVGKPSAGGQPTRSTQPFILSGSINE